MIVNLNEMKEMRLSGMNGGTGEMTAKMYGDEHKKIILSRIHAGGSIGLHKHETSDDINYIISGSGEAICDGKKELLVAGTCHICPQNSMHRIINTGGEDLVLLTIVVER